MDLIVKIWLISVLQVHVTTMACVLITLLASHVSVHHCLPVHFVIFKLIHAQVHHVEMVNALALTMEHMDISVHACLDSPDKSNINKN